MTTDLRSFLWFPRHEYFRPILCDLIGGEVERGELANDNDMLAGSSHSSATATRQAFSVSARARVW